jgi:hypothetical protein
MIEESEQLSTRHTSVSSFLFFYLRLTAGLLSARALHVVTVHFMT